MRKTFVLDLTLPAADARPIATEAGDAVPGWRRDPSREQTWKFGSHLGIRGAGRVTLAVEEAERGRSRLTVGVRRWGLVDLFGLLRREARLFHEEVAPRVRAAAEAAALPPPAITPETIERARVGLRLLALAGVIAGASMVLAVTMIGGGDDDRIVQAGVPVASETPGETGDGERCLLEVGGSIGGGEIGVALPEVSACGLDGERVIVPAPGRPTLVWVATAWDPHSEIQAGVVRDWLGSALLGDVVFVVFVGDVAGSTDGVPAWAEDPFPGVATVVIQGTEISDAFGVLGFPEWLVVDGHGIVTDRVPGRLEAAALDDLLADV